MKKLLMLSTIVFCGILFAQNLKFDKIYSTQELLSKQSSISENEKRTKLRVLNSSKAFWLLFLENGNFQNQ